MGEYREVEGDLIKLSREGAFDVIAHGCNCFCTQSSGLAPQMVKVFYTDQFSMENYLRQGDINKLGQIDSQLFQVNEDKSVWSPLFNSYTQSPRVKDLVVINAYTQFNYGRNHSDGDSKPVDYEAITLCMRKINHIFKGQHIGLPRIGCGLAGGRWSVVKGIIQKELKDCQVTIVNYKNV